MELEVINKVYKMELTKKLTLKSNCAKYYGITCGVSCNGEIIIMQIITVKIKCLNKREKARTYEVLDICSYRTFARKDIIDTPKIPRTISKTGNGTPKHSSTAADGLEVSSNKRSIKE